MKKKWVLSLGILLPFALLAGPVSAEPDEGFLPWAPATAGLPASEAQSVNKVYVHGIKPSVGMDENVGAPLSAAFVATVRDSAWGKKRTVMSGDEIRLNAPNFGPFIDNCVTGPCVIEVAKAVGCGVAISATASKIGSTFLVDAMAVDTRDGTVLTRITERVKGRDEATLLKRNGLPKVIRKLLKKIPPLKDSPAVLAANSAATSSATSTATATTITPAPADASASTTVAKTSDTTTKTAPAVDRVAVTDSTSENTVTSTAAETATSDVSTGTDEPVQELQATAVDESQSSGPKSGEGVASENDNGPLAMTGYILLGVGGAVVLGGLLSYAGALSADAEIESNPHSENQVRSVIEQGQMYQTLAVGLIGLGSVALLSGAGAAVGGNL